MNPRKVLIAAGIVLLVVGGYSAWRSANPPLNDEALIVRNIEQLTRAAQNEDAKTVTSLLASDFRWQGQSKKEINSQLAGFFFTSDEVQATVSNVSVQINGNRADVSGQFRVSFRASRFTPSEIRSGLFRSQWVKQDGDWKINTVEGMDNLAGAG
jgi:hypothetical protein